MAAGLYNFSIEKGSTVNFRIEYKDSDGTPIDLTGYQARMHIRNKPDSSIILCSLSSSLSPDGTGLNLTPVSSSVTLPVTSGSIGVCISAYSSSLLTGTQAAYDLEIFYLSSSYEVVTRILEGSIKLKPNITRT